MPRRLLNIASIACLVMCVALMAMWVRSYNAYDELRGHFGTSFGFSPASTSGRLIFHRIQIAPSEWPWRLLSDERIVDAPRSQGFWRRLGFVAEFYWNRTNIESPYWPLVLVVLFWPRRSECLGQLDSSAGHHNSNFRGNSLCVACSLR